MRGAALQALPDTIEKIAAALWPTIAEMSFKFPHREARKLSL